mmetsp:Transcript_1328/g.2362  ORF Transcript_1328/g.2362 Transcript_1328/m.2362 type:complete len:203 (-) Transcript_1328:33-641(-)
MAMGNFRLPFGLMLQTQSMFQDPACAQIMNVLSLQRDFKSFTISGRVQAMPGQSVYQATLMKSLSKNLQFGVQVNKISSQYIFGGCAYYQFGEKMKHQFSGGYNPTNPAETYNLSYITKPSPKLQIFTEMKGGSGRSECRAGGRIKMKEAVFTSYLNSDFKAFATIQKMIDPTIAMKMELHSQMDLYGMKKCQFGINITFGQ